MIPGLLLLAVVACGQRALTKADAQGAIDQWVEQRTLHDALDPSVLKQAAVDREVQRIVESGKQLSDAEYTKLQTQAKPTNVVKVLGVQELPTENAANADLDMRGFVFRGHAGASFGSMAGKARFSHYNDGRWVLTKIVWENGLYEDSPNVPVR